MIAAGGRGGRVSGGIAWYPSTFGRGEGEECKEGGGGKRKGGKTSQVFCAMSISGLGLISVPLESDFGAI